MSVKLGSGDINQIYLGSTEINQAYLGSTLIYDNTGGGGGLSRVSTATGTIASGASGQAINLPGGLLENDLVIYYAASDSAFNTNPPVTTAGYTDIVQEWTGSGPAFGATYKFMGASPDTTITVDGSTGRMGAYVVEVWRGIDTTTPLDGVAPDSNSNTSDPDALTSNTDGAVSIIAHFLDDDDLAGSGGAPSGYTGLVESDTGQGSTSSGSTVSVAYQILGAAGSIDPGAFTGIDSDARKVVHFILRAA